MPIGWKKSSLATLASYVNGFAFNEQYWSEKGLPIVRIAQITGSQPVVDRFDGQLPSHYRLNDGDLIFSWSGTLAVVRWNGGPAWLNQHLFKVEPRGDVDGNLLFHLLQRSVAEMDKRSHGSTMKHIKRGELAEYEVTLPTNLDEQSALAQVLDTLDTTIRQTEAIIAKLKQVKHGLLHDLLTRGIDANGELRPPQSEAPHLYKASPLGWIPVEWSVQPLGEIAEVSRGKFTHRPRNDPAFFGGSHPFIQTGDVASAEGGHVSTYSQTLSVQGTAVSQEFPANTIAITIAANIADTAILAVPMYFPDSVVGAVVHPQFNVRFVELSIRKAKRLLDARAPQSAQKNINLQDLRPLPLAVPPRLEQDWIAQRYEATQSRLETEGAFAVKMRQQKSGLMEDLLTGRVRVTPLLAQAPTTQP
ncbi:MAG: restriction endonuclease subunit S [Massilia sp.]|nr:restriction endonuclease subunit S [Aquabacterium sp.]